MEIYLNRRKLASGLLVYSLVRRLNRGTPEEVTKVLDYDAVTTVNSLLANKTLSITKAEALVQHVKKRLEAELTPPETPLNSVNLDIFEKYWQKRYQDKHLEDKPAAYNPLSRAIKALGSAPLPTATEKQIQKAIAENIKSRSTQRDAIAVLRRLLTYIARTDINLSKPRKNQTDISYINLEDFAIAANKLEPLEKLLCWVAIATGAR